MEKGFLAVVGALYIGLSILCTLRPEKSADAVGFALRPGSGQSEFLVVYGGLEFALGLAFLMPLVRSSETAASLALCAMVHGCLVLFRAASFFWFSGISSTTFKLAAVEWAIFIPAAILLWKR